MNNNYKLTKKDYKLTTKDNPFSPFSQFESWQRFDEQRNYNTISYLSRIANVSIELSDEENNNEIQRAIDEIVRMNLTGNYIKVLPEHYGDEN